MSYQNFQYLTNLTRFTNLSRLGYASQSSEQRQLAVKEQINALLHRRRVRLRTQENPGNLVWSAQERRRAQNGRVRFGL